MLEGVLVEVVGVGPLLLRTVSWGAAGSGLVLVMVFAGLSEGKMDEERICEMTEGEGPAARGEGGDEDDSCVAEGWSDSPDVLRPESGRMVVVTVVVVEDEEVVVEAGGGCFAEGEAGALAVLDSARDAPAAVDDDEEEAADECRPWV